MSRTFSAIVISAVSVTYCVGTTGAASAAEKDNRVDQQVVRFYDGTPADPCFDAVGPGASLSSGTPKLQQARVRINRACLLV